MKILKILEPKNDHHHQGGGGNPKLACLTLSEKYDRVVLWEEVLWSLLTGQGGRTLILPALPLSEKYSIMEEYSDQ